MAKILFLFLFFSIGSALAETNLQSTEDETKVEQSELQKEVSDCDNQLKEKLLEFIQSDKNGILQKQFELTTVKLAQEVQGSGSITLEHYIKKQSSEIRQLDSDQVIKKLNDMYTQEGISQDMLKAYEQMQAKSSKAKYWDKDLRFYNEDTSAFLIYNTLANPNSKLNHTDAAITWYMSELTKKNFGSSKTNTNNISFHITKLLGGLSGMDKKNNTELQSLANELSSEVTSLITQATDEIKKDLEGCFQEGLWEGKCNLAPETISQSLSNLILSTNQVASKSFAFFPNDVFREEPSRPLRAIASQVIPESKAIEANGGMCSHIPIEKRKGTFDEYSPTSIVTAAIGGCVVDLVRGFFSNIWDLLKSLWELGKFAFEMQKKFGKEIVSFLKAAWNGNEAMYFAEKAAQGEGLIKKIANGLKELPSTILTALNNKVADFKCMNGVAQTQMVCHAVGYLGPEALLLVFTGGTGNAAKLATKTSAAVLRVTKAQSATRAVAKASTKTQKLLPAAKEIKLLPPAKEVKLLPAMTKGDKATDATKAMNNSKTVKTPSTGVKNNSASIKSSTKKTNKEILDELKIDVDTTKLPSQYFDRMDHMTDVEFAKYSKTLEFDKKREKFLNEVLGFGDDIPNPRRCKSWLTRFTYRSATNTYKSINKLNKNPELERIFREERELLFKVCNTLPNG